MTQSEFDEERTEIVIRRVLEFIRDYPACIEDIDPEKVIPYFKIFEENREDPLLQQIIDSSQAKSYFYPYADIRIYKAHKGLVDMFNEFYDKKATENEAREPSELISLIERLKLEDEQLPKVDMSYHTVRAGLDKYPRLSAMEIFLSEAALIWGGGVALICYSLDHDKCAIGLGAIAILGLANTIKWFYNANKRSEGKKREWKTNPTLVKYSTIQKSAYEIDNFIPFYKAIFGKREENKNL